jgi:HTH-type transcriptional regulator / antitoxin MqsA
MLDAVYVELKTRVCPICEQGELTSCIENTVVTKYGEQYTVESRYSICDYCGSEQVDPEEALYNKREMEVIYGNNTNAKRLIKH